MFFCLAALATAQTPTAAKGKQVVADAIAALGGGKFLEMQDRVENGRAYSFYRDNLSGLSIAKIYTRYITVDPTKSAHELGVRERQAFGKNEDWAVVLREDAAATITYRGPKELPMEDFERYRETTLHNIFYILRQRLHEPGLEFESRGSDVVDRVPVEIVDVIDAQNFVVTVYFHQITKLPVKQSFSRLDPKTKDRDEEVTRFDRYRDNNGIQWPQQITRERNGEKIYQIFAETVSFNQGLADDLFSISSTLTTPRKK
ncbi:MAG: hypothetical protein M3O20_15090 [Acidobacteriota bacterium]|nr:hypothetical protein [Acidobacteriota bacterium]